MLIENHTFYWAIMPKFLKSAVDITPLMQLEFILCTHETT
jgi:hypothetical protein